MHKAVLTVITVLVAGYGLYTIKAQSPPSAPAPAPEKVFSGRVLVIYPKSDPETGVTIENAAIRRLGGREFLVGICVDTGDEEEWRDGLPVWTAMDDISQIVEAPSSDDLKNRWEGPEELAPSNKESRKSHAHDRASADHLSVPALESLRARG